MTTLTTSQTTTSQLDDNERMPTEAEMYAARAAVDQVDAVALTKDLMSRFGMSGPAATETAVMFMDCRGAEFYLANGEVWYIEPDLQIRGGVVYIMEDGQ